MQKSALLPFAIAGLLVTLLIGGILYNGYRNRLEVNGEILKVRTHQMDPENTIAVLDLRLHNPSRHDFIVRNVQVFVEDPDGKVTEIDRFSELDAMRVFEYYPVLGQKYNQSLIPRDRINSGQTVDRMITIGLNRTEAVVQNRKQFRIVLTEVDRVKSEIVEKR